MLKAWQAQILLVICSLQVATNSVSEDKKEGYSSWTANGIEAEVMNGKSWIALDQQSRITYLVGLEDGAALLVAELGELSSDRGLGRTANSALEQLMVQGFKFSDIVQEIDEFYNEASNRRIPIVEAYRYEMREFKGFPSKDLDELKSTLRRKYNK